MTAGERRWCWWLSAGLMGLTSLPYVWAAVAPHPGWAFSGFLFGVDDGNSYLAKMRAGAMGAWLFRTPYTLFPQAGALAFLPYILLGKLVAWQPSHSLLAFVYHAFRLAVIPLEVFSAYGFTALFVSRPELRRWVVFMATLGGGLGWAVLVLWPAALQGGLPLSFISPESFGFLALFGLPHLVLARSFLLLALTAAIRARMGLISPWVSGGWVMGLSLVQPIGLVPLAALMGGLSAIVLAKSAGVQDLWRRLRAEIGWLVRAWLLPLPIVVVLGWSALHDPYLKIWAAQNRILSPSGEYYLMAYAAVLLPAAWGAWKSIRSKLGEGRLVPVVWLILLPALAYAPFTVQRRFVEGSWLAWLVLAAIGLEQLAPTWRRGLLAGLLLVSLPSAVLLLVGGLRTASAPARPAFLPAEDAGALSWLSENADPGTVLIAWLPDANAAPAWAPVRVPVGHGPESADYEVQRAEVQNFYSGLETPNEQQVFLTADRAGFVLYGPEERTLGSWTPAQLPGLERVFADGDVELYRWTGGSGPAGGGG